MKFLLAAAFAAVLAVPSLGAVVISADEDLIKADTPATSAPTGTQSTDTQSTDTQSTATQSTATQSTATQSTATQSTATQPTAAPINCSAVIDSYDQVEPVLKQCQNVVLGSFVVPAGKTLFLQPAMNDTTITATGNISFAHHEWLGPLVQINGSRLHIIGTPDHVFDGMGQLYWDGKGEWGTKKPDFFWITAFDSVMEYLNIIHTPKYFTQINDSKNLTMSHFYLFNLEADKDWAEPYHSGGNSDGFNVWNSSDILIENSEIFNQDDCIALRSGDNIHVRNLFCHGGQGFSMSLGWSNDTEKLNTLTNVLVEDSSFIKGHNAVHIKTHIDSGNGTAVNITYKNIYFEVANHGIQIQQNFRNLPKGSHQPKEPKGNIPIKNLKLINVKGFVTNQTQGIPVYILCAEGACENWEWTGVNVTGRGDPHWHDKCNYEPIGFNCTSAPDDTSPSTSSSVPATDSSTPTTSTPTTTTTHKPNGASTHIASFCVVLVALFFKVFVF